MLRISGGVGEFFDDLWLEQDQEQAVAKLNNWWVALEGIARKTAMIRRDETLGELRATVLEWESWRNAYKQAVLRRWLPGGPDWGEQFALWSEKFREQVELVIRAGGKTAYRQIKESGIDVRFLPEPDAAWLEQVEETIASFQQAAGGAGEQAAKGFFWPAVGLGLSAGLIIWLVTKRKKKL